MNDHEESARFTRRAGELLRSHAESVDATTRSRLARARAAAVDAARSAPRGRLLPLLVPAGAAAAALLVALLVNLDTSPMPGEATPLVAATDLDLLADADAFELSQEADLEFIEWAAAIARQEAGGG